MQATGVKPLKESQIISWWSTYHQKRKRLLTAKADYLRGLHARHLPLALPFLFRKPLATLSFLFSKLLPKPLALLFLISKPLLLKPPALLFLLSTPLLLRHLALLFLISKPPMLRYLALLFLFTQAAFLQGMLLLATQTFCSGRSLLISLSQYLEGDLGVMPLPS